MQNINIYALGDSITYGFPFGSAYSWVKMVSQSLGIRIINGGINGDTTAFMLQRLPQALASKPSHLLLLGGTNDAYWGQPLSVVGDNFSRICTSCKAANIPVILGLPTPVDEHGVEVLLSDYRNFLNDLAKRHGYNTIPFHQAFLDKDGRFKAELTTDGCHPNIDGYEAMAEVAELFLPQILGLA